MSHIQNAVVLYLTSSTFIINERVKHLNEWFISREQATEVTRLEDRTLPN